MTDEVVTRLYRCLVEALRSRGQAGAEPLRVADVHRDIVPYQAVRSALGVALKADYEHALLRLLAGERGLLRVDDEQARERLRREAEAPYPAVGLFREFDDLQVRVTLPEEADGLEADSVGGARANAPLQTPAAPAPPIPLRPDRGSEPQRVTPAAGATPLRTGRRGGPVPARAAAAVHILRDDGDPEREAVERRTGAVTTCAFCEEPLPSKRRVRFCPHCGGDQRLRPCPRCDAVLEREWRYCISCGHESSEPR